MFNQDIIKALLMNDEKANQATRQKNEFSAFLLRLEHIMSFS